MMQFQKASYGFAQNDTIAVEVKSCLSVRKPEVVQLLITFMCIHFKPVYQFSAFRACMLCNFLGDPLGNAYFLHTHRVWNHISVIANSIYNRLFAEFSQLFTRKLFAFIAASSMMTYDTVKKTMVCTVFTAVTNIIRKAAMASIRKRRTCPAEQAAYRSTFFCRYSVHKPSPLKNLICRIDHIK